MDESPVEEMTLEQALAEIDAGHERELALATSLRMSQEELLESGRKADDLQVQLTASQDYVTALAAQIRATDRITSHEIAMVAAKLALPLEAGPGATGAAVMTAYLAARDGFVTPG